MMEDALTSQENDRAAAFFDKLFSMAPERIAAAKLDRQNALRLSVVAIYGRGTIAHDKLQYGDDATKRIGKSCFSFVQDKTYPCLYRLRAPVQAGIVGREVYVAFEGGKNPQPSRNNELFRHGHPYGFGNFGYQ